MRQPHPRQAGATPAGQVQASNYLWSYPRYIRLICGDSTKPAVVSRLFAMSESHFRMVCTDSPYGINYASKNEYLNRSDRGNRIQRPIANDDSPNVHALLTNALRIGREWALPGAVAYATVPSGPLLPGFIDAFNTSGFTFRHLLVWLKQQFVIGMSDYRYRHEAILYGWGNGPHYWAGIDRKIFLRLIGLMSAISTQRRNRLAHGSHDRQAVGRRRNL